MDDYLIPYICEGEIIEVNETPVESAPSPVNLSNLFGIGPLKPRQIVSYTCVVQLNAGQRIVCPSVIDSSMLGGIDDYMQIRRRATRDASEYEMTIADDMNAHVGDRVYIAFIGGSILRPVIIASAQHPTQTMRFEDGVSPNVDPQLFLRYLGISLVIDDEGQLSLTHFGAPSIRYTGTQTGLGASVASSPPSGYKGYDEGIYAADEVYNAAVEPQDYRFKTTTEFMKSGMYRIRDSIGQNLVIDPEKSQITLTNMGLSSTDDASGGLSGAIGGGGSGEDAEVIRMDKKAQSIFINSRKLTTIYSGEDRKDATEGDYTKKVQGNEKITIIGDQTEGVKGNVTRTITGDLDDTVHGDVSQTFNGYYDQSVTDDATISITGDKDESVTGDISLDGKGEWTVSFISDVSISTEREYSVDSVGNITQTSKGDITLSALGGAGMKLSAGKAEIGGASTGIFASTLDILDQLDAILTAIGAMTVPTGTGPSGPPINSADFLKAQGQLKTIRGKLKTVAGSL